MTIIVATAVLHNIARANADENPPEDPALNLPTPQDDVINEGRMNDQFNAQNNINATRIQIINEYFKRYIIRYVDIKKYMFYNGCVNQVLEKESAHL